MRSLNSFQYVFQFDPNWVTFICNLRADFFLEAWTCGSLSDGCLRICTAVFVLLPGNLFIMISLRDDTTSMKSSIIQKELQLS